MPMSEEYVPREAGASLGSRGEDVLRANRYLARFGYLDSPRLRRTGLKTIVAKPAPAEMNTFDEATEVALRTFQRFVGLPETGIIDEATIAKMSQDRCGNLDVAAEDVAGYELSGCQWERNNLRYAFENFSTHLTSNQVRSAVRDAFDLWAEVVPLTFTEVPVSQNHEILIRFGTDDHNDCPFPFEGTSPLAHNFYPPDCGGDLAGDSHYNDENTWSVDSPPSDYDLVTVAAHEFGHALGLAHSSEDDALMYPYYSGEHRWLHQDDINGIQAIYGSNLWHHNRLIQRLFVTHEARNCWAYVQDVGWKKVEPSDTDGVTNMNLALCAARRHNIRVSVLEEQDTIRRMYL